MIWKDDFKTTEPDKNNTEWMMIMTWHEACQDDQPAADACSFCQPAAGLFKFWSRKLDLLNPTIDVECAYAMTVRHNTLANQHSHMSEISRCS